MTYPGDQPRDDRLADLVSDAVSDVEPANRLDAIREQTAATSLRRRRSWLYAGGGAVVATAAVITAIALATGGSPAENTADPDPATSPTAVDSPSAQPSESVTEPSSADSPVAVYFVGDTPEGPRLFREFQRSEGPLLTAAGAAVAGEADDPDYTTIWPDGATVLDAATPTADVITVDLTGVPEDLPDGMTADEARLALQQVVYGVQGSVADAGRPVRFEIDGAAVDTVLGQPAARVTRAPENEVRALVNVSDPGEGTTVSGIFTATGVADSFEANVPWEVRSGDEVVLEGFATAAGWMGKLFPWESEVDVSGLDAGEYTFVAMTDDPSGGAEGNGPTTDTRTIVIE